MTAVGSMSRLLDVRQVEAQVARLRRDRNIHISKAPWLWPGVVEAIIKALLRPPVPEVPLTPVGISMEVDRTKMIMAGVVDLPATDAATAKTTEAATPEVALLSRAVGQVVVGFLWPKNPVVRLIPT